VINENVRGKDVYIIQPTSPPVNETLMELLLMIRLGFRFRIRIRIMINGRVRVRVRVRVRK
jgi:hypothetical protein